MTKGSGDPRWTNTRLPQSAGAVEYTDCISAEE